MKRLAPSLLSVDFLHLDSVVDAVNAHADIFHMDVMDGVLVPNISFGFPVVKSVAGKASKPLDVHLMITSPERYALDFAKIPSVGMVSFHLEAVDNPVSLLENLRGAGVKAGLAINPDFPLQKFFPFVEYCDFVLVMGVFAGFSGQKFIEGTFDRVRTVKSWISEHSPETEIEVDGGVSRSNIRELADAGTDIFVTGSSVFNSADPASEMDALRALLQEEV